MKRCRDIPNEEDFPSKKLGKYADDSIAKNTVATQFVPQESQDDFTKNINYHYQNPCKFGQPVTLRIPRYGDWSEMDCNKNIIAIELPLVSINDKQH